TSWPSERAIAETASARRGSWLATITRSWPYSRSAIATPHCERWPAGRRRLVEGPSAGRERDRIVRFQPLARHTSCLRLKDTPAAVARKFAGVVVTGPT